MVLHHSSVLVVCLEIAVRRSILKLELLNSPLSFCVCLVTPESCNTELRPHLSLQPIWRFIPATWAMSLTAKLQKATEITILKASKTSKLWAAPKILFYLTFYIESYGAYKDLRNPRNYSLSQQKGANNVVCRAVVWKHEFCCSSSSSWKQCINRLHLYLKYCSTFDIKIVHWIHLKYCWINYPKLNSKKLKVQLFLAALAIYIFFSTHFQKHYGLFDITIPTPF